MTHDRRPSRALATLRRGGGELSRHWASSVKRVTRLKYQGAVRDFCLWLDANDPAAALNLPKWDTALVSYLAEMRRSGRGKCGGNYVVAGLRLVVPQLRLVLAAKVMKAWNKAQPSEPWPCMPNSFNLLLVEAARLRGWVCVAGWIRVAFVTMLRISASARMLWTDVALPGDPRFAGMKAKCYLRVGRDKRVKTPRLFDVYCPLGLPTS